MIKVAVYVAGLLQYAIDNADILEHDIDGVFAGSDSGEFTIASTNPAVAYLDEDTASVYVKHSGGWSFTAWVTAKKGTFGAAAMTERVYEVRSSWCVLNETLAWVVPENGIAPRQQLEGRADLAQAVATGATTPGTVANQNGYFAWQGTTVEDAVLDIVARNLRRMGWDVIVPTSQGRGGTPAALPDVRFRTLAEAILPVLETAGLGIDVRLNGTSLRLVILEPKDYGQLLTTSGAVRTGAKWTLAAPTATRVVVGGPGEDASRQWWSVIDTALEERFGRRVEVTRDATGAKLEWPTTFNQDAKVPKYYLSQSDMDVSPEAKAAFVSYLEAAAREVLADRAPSASLSAQLAETETFALGAAYNLGDRVRIQEQADFGPVFHDRISSVRIVRTRRGAEVVTPVIGGAEKTNEQQVWAAIAKVAARQRRMTTEK